MSISPQEIILPNPSRLTEITPQFGVFHEQRLSPEILADILQFGPISGMGDLSFDIPSNGPEPLDGVCQISSFMIPGSYALTDEAPTARPVEMPCTLTYDSEGRANLHIGQIQLDQFAPEGSNVLFIGPIAGLTVDGGSIPIMVQTHLDDPGRSGASAICPMEQDLFSNLMLGNPSSGSGLSQDTSHTTACYDASEKPARLYMYDNNYQPHEVLVTFDLNGDTFIFQKTSITESGLFKINLGTKEKFAAIIESAFVQATLSQLGENTVFMIASNGINFESISNTPIYTEPTTTPEQIPLPILSTMTPESAPNIDTSPLAGIQETAPVPELIRPVIGTHEETDLICLDHCNFSVIMVDEESVIGNDLRNLLLTNSHSKLIPQITQMLRDQTTPWWKFKNSIHNLFAPIRREEKIFPDANKLETGNGIVLQDLRILQQRQVGGDMITYALHTDNAGTSRTIIIQTTVKDWLKYTSTKMLNNSGATDMIGTTIHNQIEKNQTIPDNGVDRNENSQDLFYFPAVDITRTMSISRLSSLSQNNLSSNPYAVGWILDSAGNISYSDRIPSSVHGRDLGLTTWEDGKWVRWIEVWYGDLPTGSSILDPKIQIYTIGIETNSLTTAFIEK